VTHNAAGIQKLLLHFNARFWTHFSQL
jgi:hypothetical protein